jgi:hypothetical protein
MVGPLSGFIEVRHVLWKHEITSTIKVVLCPETQKSKASKTRPTTDTLFFPPAESGSDITNHKTQSSSWSSRKHHGEIIVVTIVVTIVVNSQQVLSNNGYSTYQNITILHPFNCHLQHLVPLASIDFRK